MALSAAVAAESNEPSEEQVLAFLSKLQPEHAAALLAKASQRDQTAEKDQTQVLQVPEAVLEGAGNDRSEESAKEAMRAIAAGNFAVAQELGPKADLCCLGEDGWGCLHWLVHVAGAALGKEEHAVGCQCCHSSSAKGRGPALALLHDFLSSEHGRVAVHLRNSQGATALMFAADAGDEEVCLELLRARADVSATDSDGDSAEAWALAKGHETLVDLLHSAD